MSPEATPPSSSGPGPIGIGLWFALRGKALETVFVVEPSATRRDAVEALGAQDARSDGHRRAGVHRRRTPTDAAPMPRSMRPAWRPRSQAALASVGARKPTISVAIYEKPLITPLLNLVMNESRIQGSLCYTSADFEAVIALMAQGGYDTTGWVTPISIDDVVDEGFEALHAGTKMKVLVDPTI